MEIISKKGNFNAINVLKLKAYNVYKLHKPISLKTSPTDSFSM